MVYCIFNKPQEKLYKILRYNNKNHELCSRACVYILALKSAVGPQPQPHVCDVGVEGVSAVGWVLSSL